MTTETQWAYCENCGSLYEEEQLAAHFPNIPQLLSRIEPGGEVPIGECQCGALAYKAEKGTATQD